MRKYRQLFDCQVVEIVWAQGSFKDPKHHVWEALVALTSCLGPSGLGPSMRYSSDGHRGGWGYNKGRKCLVKENSLWQQNQGMGEGRQKDPEEGW